MDLPPQRSRRILAIHHAHHLRLAGDTSACPAVGATGRSPLHTFRRGTRYGRDPFARRRAAERRSRSPRTLLAYTVGSDAHAAAPVGGPGIRSLALTSPSALKLMRRVGPASRCRPCERSPNARTGLAHSAWRAGCVSARRSVEGSASTAGSTRARASTSRRPGRSSRGRLMVTTASTTPCRR